jgi:hypothetical protein
MARRWDWFASRLSARYATFASCRGLLVGCLPSAEWWVRCER